MNKTIARQRAVLVTGSSGGLGRALCMTFRSAGFFIIGLDNSGDGQDCDVFLREDLIQFSRDCDRRNAVHEQIVDVLGGRPMAALINNAAVQKLGALATLDEADWMETLQVNLLAPFFLVQIFLSELQKASASVVNIASIHARLTKPGFAAYASSKAALIGLTQSMALELAPAIRINAIAPAAIETDMLKASFADNYRAYARLESCHPMQRIGRPDEVAQTALFLCSDVAHFINGAVLQLDGGISSCLYDSA